MQTIGDRNFDAARAVAARLSGDETAVCAARLSMYLDGPTRWSSLTAVVTSRRVLVIKEKLFGAPKANASFELAEIASTGCGPLMGVGPTWSVDFVTDRHRPIQLYFLAPDESMEFDRRLRDAIALVRGQGS